MSLETSLSMKNKSDLLVYPGKQLYISKLPDLHEGKHLRFLFGAYAPCTLHPLTSGFGTKMFAFYILEFRQLTYVDFLLLKPNFSTELFMYQEEFCKTVITR